MTPPCDPEDYNDHRAKMVERSIHTFAHQAYKLQADRDDHEMVLSDLLCNLHHWADRHGVDFDQRVLVAEHNYRDETTCQEENQCL